MTGGRWRKQRLALTSDAWAPVIAPAAMDYVALRCDTSAVRLRTDVDDPATEDTIPAGVQEGVTSTRNAAPDAPVYGGHRFQGGEAICRVQSVAPTATLIVTWVD